jgi:FdhD protein
MTAAWSRRASRLAWRDGRAGRGEREIARETPVALTYNASTYAVMMATPADLEDFAVGFSLTERIVDAAGDIEDLQIVASDLGVEARMWLGADRAARLAERRRHIAGPTGCGLCGVESLEAAHRAGPVVGAADARLTPAQILGAMAALAAGQPLNDLTRAAHAAGFAAPGGGLAAVREDVGRHNALDKLVGALASAGVVGEGGAVLLTSRVSVEMVQKSAVLGAAFVIAVSAPTTLAIDAAEAAGVTLIGVTRADGFEVFTRPERVDLDARG